MFRPRVEILCLQTTKTVLSEFLFHYGIMNIDEHDIQTRWPFFGNKLNVPTDLPSVLAHAELVLFWRSGAEHI